MFETLQSQERFISKVVNPVSTIILILSRTIDVGSEPLNKRSERLMFLDEQHLHQEYLPSVKDSLQFYCINALKVKSAVHADC